MENVIPATTANDILDSAHTQLDLMKQDGLNNKVNSLLGKGGSTWFGRCYWQR